MHERIDRESVRKYLKVAVIIGLPVIFQNMISSLINMLDVFMLGQLGEVEITGASLSNQWFLLFCVLANGIAAAGAMFISQYWGKQDKTSIHQYMGIMFCFSMGLALVFFSLSVICPQVVLGLYSMDQAVKAEGARYLRIMAASFLLYSLNVTLATALRSIEQTRVPMVASVVSLGCNAIGNYILIFGKFGVEPLGIKGAAIATVLARIVEIGISTGYVLWKKNAVYGNIREYFQIPEEKIRNFFRFGGMVILGEVVYAIGSNLYNVAYKYTGTQAQAALQIIQSVQGIALLFCGGFGTAAAVMLGSMLGKSEFEEAKKCSIVLLTFSVLLSLVSVVTVWVAGPLFLQNFNIGPEARAYAGIMLKIMALSIPLRTIVYMVICGILRSGGDNLYCFYSNLVGVWCVGLPMVFLTAVVFHAPVYVVYIMATLEEAGKILICGPRALKGEWLRNLTEIG